jgi:hypothetical protein
MNNDFFEAANVIADIDDGFIADAANAKKAPARIYKWLAAAAAVVVLAGAAIALPKLIKPKGNEISAQLPTNAPSYAEETSMPGEAASTNAPMPTDAWIAPIQTTAEPMSTAEPAEPKPTAHAMANYDSVQTLQLAVSSGKNADKNDPLYGLDYIYMPARVPDGAELRDIEITREYASVSYFISHEFGPDVDEDDPEYPDRFVLIWHRDWQEGSAEEYARSLHDSMSGYFFCETFGMWTFQTGLERVAVWEENGRGFTVIIPCSSADREEIVRFRDVVKVALDETNAHEPYVGNDDGGYLKLKENNLTEVPVTTFAYGVTYYKPETLGGGEGRMMRAEGVGFIESIPEEQYGYDHIFRYFPQTSYLFEPVLRDNAEIVRIDVYDPITLEPLELDIELDRLYRIAIGDVEEELNERIFGPCRGGVLVDMIVLHNGDYIEDLDEYEYEAYHCGFIIDCGY